MIETETCTDTLPSLPFETIEIHSIPKTLFRINNQYMQVQFTEIIENVEIEIITTQGTRTQHIFKTNVDNVLIDMLNHSPGIYFFNIKLNNKP